MWLGPRLTLEAGAGWCCDHDLGTTEDTGAGLSACCLASASPGVSACLSLGLEPDQYAEWALGTKCDSQTLGPHQWPLQFSARLMPPLLQSDLLNQCQTAWFIFQMDKERIVKLNVRLIFYLIHMTHCWHCSWGWFLFAWSWPCVPIPPLETLDVHGPTWRLWRRMTQSTHTWPRIEDYSRQKWRQGGVLSQAPSSVENNLILSATQFRECWWSKAI